MIWFTRLKDHSNGCVKNRKQKGKSGSRETRQETIAMIPVINDGGLDQGHGSGASEKQPVRDMEEFVSELAVRCGEGDKSRLMTKPFSRGTSCMELIFADIGRLGKEQD